MSKKHFIAIAANFKTQIEAVRASKSSISDKAVGLDTIFATTNILCGVFADANPRFDRARFMTA